MIGIMGEYIGKILSELKARPVYFVAEHSLKTADDAGRAANDPPARSAAESQWRRTSEGTAGRQSPKGDVAERVPRKRRAPRIWLCADDYGISPRSTPPSAT